MEFLKKYWPYILAGLVILVFLLRKSGASQPQVISLAAQGGGEREAIASAERVQQSSIAANMFSQFLGYDIAKRNVVAGESIQRAALQSQDEQFRYASNIQAAGMEYAYNIENRRISEGSALSRLALSIQQALGFRQLDIQETLGTTALENERRAAKGQKNVALAGINAQTTIAQGEQSIQSQAIAAQLKAQQRKSLFDLISGLASTFNPLSLFT